MSAKIILWGILAALGLFAAVIAICALLVDPNKTYDSPSRLYRFLLISASWLTLKLARVHLHVTGKEKLPRDCKILFVGNHLSKFDPITTWVAFREWDIAFISKPENFKIPLFGRIIHRCCFLPIDRKSPRNAISAVHDAAGLLSGQTVSVGVYPEGTRGKGGELLPFHDGMFKIAKLSGAPVAVLAVSGTNRIAKNFPLRKTDVYLDILCVFDAQSVQAADTHALSAAAAQLLRRNMEMRANTCPQATYLQTPPPEAETETESLSV